jgi:hypothetical protein
MAANSTNYTDQNIFCKAGLNDYEYRINVYKDTLSGYSPLRSYNPCDLAAKNGRKVAQTLGTPRETLLEVAYPNPFNSQTTIRFMLAKFGPVRLVVYDALGREVAVPAEGVFPAGTHQVTFTANDLPSGVYFYRLETEDKSFLRTMLLAR